MASDAAQKDYKYQSYKSDMDGWKVLTNCYHHVDDRGLDFMPRKLGVTENGRRVCYESDPVRVALFGLGRIGTIHFEHLIRNPQIELLYCVEQCKERAQYIEFKWNLKNTKILTPKEADTVFNDPKVDAVVICTPTFTHEDILTRALEAGKAVLCEKPLSDNAEGIKRCYELAKKVQKPLLCAFNRRFDPGFRDIKSRIAQEVGKIQVIKTCSRDSPLPPLSYLKYSGGIFHDCAVHDIDLICWITEEYPTSVTAFGHAFIKDIKDLDDFDTVGILMKFPSGAIGIIDLSRNSVYGYDQRLEVFGPKGMLCSSEGIRPTDVSVHSTKGTTIVPIYYSFASRYYDAYSFEVKHFVEAVQGRSKVCVDGRSTIAVSRIASASEEAAKTGKTVYLSWDDSELSLG